MTNSLKSILIKTTLTDLIKKDIGIESNNMRRLFLMQKFLRLMKKK